MRNMPLGFGVTSGCKRCKNFCIETGVMGINAIIKSKWCTNNNAILQSGGITKNDVVGIPLKHMYNYCKNKKSS